MTDSDVRVETWAVIPGYFGELTSDGRVRSVDRVLASNGRRVKGGELAQTVTNRGYVQVKLYDAQGVRQTRTVHTLMMLTFEGPCPPGKQVRHWNDVPTDNRWAPGGEASCGPGKPGNLVYGTPKEQWDDKLRNAAPEPSLSRRVVNYVGSLLRFGRRSR